LGRVVFGGKRRQKRKKRIKRILIAGEPWFVQATSVDYKRFRERAVEKKKRIQKGTNLVQGKGLILPEKR